MSELWAVLLSDLLGFEGRTGRGDGLFGKSKILGAAMTGEQDNGMKTGTMVGQAERLVCPRQAYSYVRRGSVSIAGVRVKQTAGCLLDARGSCFVEPVFMLS